MGRNARKEAIVKLRDQLAATDDVKLIIQISRQIAKLSPKKKAVMGRPRNETPSRKTLAKDAAAVDAQSTYVRNGSAMDNMPLGRQTLHRLVLALEAEHKRRGFAGEPDMTAEEEVTFTDKIVTGFSDAERAALYALEPQES
jgi:hypothetical protein